jgi:hypothetical protein
MNLHPVTIEFDLMYLAFTTGHLLDGCREGALDVAGEGCLNAYSCRFLALKRHHQNSHATKADSNWHRSNRSAREKQELSRIITRCCSQRKVSQDGKGEEQSSRSRKQDRARVAAGQDYELRYEAKKTKRSASAVKKAVKKVGISRKRVERRLGR